MHVGKLQLSDFICLMEAVISCPWFAQQRIAALLFSPGGDDLGLYGMRELITFHLQQLQLLWKESCGHQTKMVRRMWTNKISSGRTSMWCSFWRKDWFYWRIGRLLPMHDPVLTSCAWQSNHDCDSTAWLIYSDWWSSRVMKRSYVMISSPELPSRVMSWV